MCFTLCKGDMIIQSLKTTALKIQKLRFKSLCLSPTTAFAFVAVLLNFEKSQIYTGVAYYVTASICGSHAPVLTTHILRF